MDYIDEYPHDEHRRVREQEEDEAVWGQDRREKRVRIVPTIQGHVSSSQKPCLVNESD